MNRMRPLSSLTALLLAGCAAGVKPVSSQPALTARERIEVLDEVIIMRYGRISNWGQVDACSVYRALGRDPAFRERLNTTARSKLSAESAGACDSTPAPVRGRWYVREISRTAAGEVGVVVAVYGESGTHRETYVLDQGYGHGMWRLREVRLSDFSID